jgi:hypothetical protein
MLVGRLQHPGHPFVGPFLQNARLMQRRRSRESHGEIADGRLYWGGVELAFDDLVFVRELGTGANGSVFEAHERTLSRRVAVKIWNLKMNDRRSRALDETKKLVSLSHPQMVVVHRFGTVAEWPYALMELVPGVALRDFLARERPLLSVRTKIWSQLSAVLGSIYSRGLVHGDPHTGNILVFPDPYTDAAPTDRTATVSIKLADTGTSRIWKSEQAFVARERKVLLKTAQRLLQPIWMPDLLDLRPEDDHRAVRAACDALAEISYAYSFDIVHHEGIDDLMHSVFTALRDTPPINLRAIHEILCRKIHEANAADAIRCAVAGTYEASTGRPFDPVELHALETRYARRREEGHAS